MRFGRLDQPLTNPLAESLELAGVAQGRNFIASFAIPQQTFTHSKKKETLGLRVPNSADVLKGDTIRVAEVSDTS